MGDFGSNRAAWLMAGFLGRKLIKDMLGRWSVIPVLAVGLCVWTKWKTRQEEGRREQGKLEQIRSKTRQQLHVLHKRSPTGHLRPSPSLSPSCDRDRDPIQTQRRQGDRLGGIPTSATPSIRAQHASPSSAAAAINRGSGTAATSKEVGGGPKDALASELWAWLGGVGMGRVCASADRSRRSRGGGGGGGGGGEWRGAFTNRMGNLPRRNAFKTARGKVYLRSSGRRPGWGRAGAPAPSVGILESVREEDEGSVGS